MLLLLTMLVPLLGATVGAGIAVRDRWQMRTAAAALEHRAADLALQTQFVSALGSEEAHSSLLALTTSFDGLGDTLDIDLTRARVAGARALVDSARFAAIRDELDLEEPLRRLRTRVDLASIDYEGVAEFFRTTDVAIADAWSTAMVEVDDQADRAALPAELRRRLRSLRATMAAFTVADERVDHALNLLLYEPTPTRTRLLVDASARFDAGFDAALQSASPHVEQTWTRWRTEPAAQRTEETIALAERVGLGIEPPLGELSPAVLSQGLTDGARWAILLTDIVRAAAVDLEEGASDHASGTARSMAVHLAATAGLIAASLALGALVARSITTPVRRLESAVRRVEAGEFRLDPLPDRGPRELAAVARAVNDMSGTLAAVEGHAVALASDPGSPVLEDRLPGRTGEAMQAAIDRLRSSIADAEDRRAELTQLASHDALTGLLNRRAALEAMERDLARARRDGSTLLALFLDLDGLKELNDTHGHAAGDEAIQRTADALRASTRDGDVVARLGGDEFVVVGPLPPEGRAGADAFAHRVRDAVRAQAVRTPDGAVVALRCSVGGACSDAGTGTVDELVRAADLALYAAKEAGRDQVAWSTALRCRSVRQQSELDGYKAVLLSDPPGTIEGDD